MSQLDFEQRHRLETEVLPAVIDDPEYAAATIVRLEAERDRLRLWIENVATDSQLDQPVRSLGGMTGRKLVCEDRLHNGYGQYTSEVTGGGY